MNIVNKKYVDVNRFFDITNDLMCVMDSNGHLVSMNKQFEHTFGLNFQNMEIKPFWEYLQTVDQSLAHRRINQLIRKGMSISFESRILKETDVNRWIYWTCHICRANEILIYAVGRDVTEEKNSKASLEEATVWMKVQKKSIEQKAIALKEVLNQIQHEQHQTRENVMVNIENFIIPILEKIKRNGGSRKYCELLHENLKNITDSFGPNIRMKVNNLSNREIEICNMVEKGMSNKEIAGMLNISLHTVEKHRLNIRKKIGLDSREISLASYLRTLRY